MSGRPAVFLDRDGVLNYNRRDYVKNPRELVAIPGAAQAAAALKRAGWVVVVVSNQSGVGRGLFDESTLGAIMTKLRAGLAAAGGSPDAIYYCPHLPAAGCGCRKPAPGMLFRAARELDLDLARSVFVGDSRCDVECGRAAGTRTVLVQTGLPEQRPDPAVARPDYVAQDLPRAAAWILEQRELAGRSGEPLIPLLPDCGRPRSLTG